MTLAARTWLIGAALLGALASASVYSQPVTERQAALYIYGGFRHDAVHAILSPNVRLGPELRRRLELPPGADSRAIYDVLVTLSDQKTMVVRKAAPEELARYAPGAGLRQPLFALEVGDTTLLIQYDLQANNIQFVGQLAGPMDRVVARKPEPPKPVAAPEPPKPVAAPEPSKPESVPPVIAPEPPKAVALPPEPPKPVAVPEPPKPVAAPEPPKPVAAPAPPKPVAAPAPPKPVTPPEPVVVRPEPPKPRAAAPQPPRPQLKPEGPCVVKPVMSNQDLVNCGATPP